MSKTAPLKNSIAVVKSAELPAPGLRLNLWPISTSRACSEMEPPIRQTVANDATQGANEPPTSRSDVSSAENTGLPTGREP